MNNKIFALLVASTLASSATIPEHDKNDRSSAQLVQTKQTMPPTTRAEQEYSGLHLPLGENATLHADGITAQKITENQYRIIRYKHGSDQTSLTIFFAYRYKENHPYCASWKSSGLCVDHYDELTFKRIICTDTCTLEERIYEKQLLSAYLEESLSISPIWITQRATMGDFKKVEEIFSLTSLIDTKIVPGHLESIYRAFKIEFERSNIYKRMHSAR